MKIRDIITERKDATKVGNDAAKISRTAKSAAERFITADNGVGPEGHDEVSHLLAHVRDMYGGMLPHVVDLSFKSPWWVSCIWLWLTPDAMGDYERGEYRDLDSLNASLGLLSMGRIENNGA